jgi:hypothetical protein
MIDTFFMKRYKYDSAAVAQTVEQRTENPCVNSSILFGGTKEIALSGVISFFFLWITRLSRRALLRTHHQNDVVSYISAACRGTKKPDVQPGFGMSTTTSGDRNFLTRFPQAVNVAVRHRI